MTNWSCGSIPEFDELYRQSQQVKPGPERDALYRKMTRLLEVYMPVQMSYARYRNMLAQPRIIDIRSIRFYMLNGCTSILIQIRNLIIK